MSASTLAASPTSSSTSWSDCELLLRTPPGEIEAERCRRSPERFVDRHCRLRDESGAWVPFSLWPAQREALAAAAACRLCCWLKARQLGMTWLALAGRALHKLLFRPGVTVLLFSLREEEAKELLTRLKGVHANLPDFLKAEVVKDRETEWVLSNGSRAKAFPSNKGDSYTAALAVIDEADLIPDLNRLLGSVKPTIDAGGELLLLSRPDKSKPDSPFKRIYRAAKAGANGWGHCFLPWHARPDRDRAWYEAQKAEVLHRTGALDDLHEQYPATDAEALAPRSLDKRIPPAWLNQCYQELPPLGDDQVPGKPAVPGLVVYRLPEPGRRYVIGCDPAEGNPTSDDSAAAVLEAATGEEVARWAGRHEPGAMAAYCDLVGAWYNGAPVMVERNNHGHAVVLALRASGRLKVLRGHDGRPGWLSSQAGKVLLYTRTAEACRDKQTLIHSFAVLTQLMSIEGNTLRAPEGEKDDLADAHALGVVGALAVRRYSNWKLETFE